MKTIQGFPNYVITKSGRVWSKKRKSIIGRSVGGRWLLPRKNICSGHLSVQLYCRKRICQRYIHRLVLETYVGPCPEGMECRHLDGNPENNELPNLKWGTRGDNMKDAVKHGTHRIPKHNGKGNVNTKLRECDVRFIFNSYWSGKYNLRELAEKFDVTESNICSITNKKTWKHLWKQQPCAI